MPPCRTPGRSQRPPPSAPRPVPTPVVSVPPDVAGIRIVVRSGERVDLVWTVPAVTPSAAWQVGCHIPGHWARGMLIPVRWVGDVPAS